MSLLRLGVVLAGAYVLGSLPTGVFWSRVARGIDVRLHGSGRTGGTNVWRSAGLLPALLTVICDGLKGAAAVGLASLLGVWPWARAAAAAFAVVGHNYSVFLGFAGGAGTSTSVGAAAALWLPSLPLLAVSGLIVGLLVGHASVASIWIAVGLPILFLLKNEIITTLVFALPAMALTLWALRPNIRRLLKREERFLPIYKKRPPPIRLSDHPSWRSSSGG